MLALDAPFPQFFDLDGRPLDAGYVYIGVENENPQTSPVAAYWDAELTIPAAQPLRTKNGLIARNGIPAFVYVAGNHSMLVQNAKKVQVLYARSSRQFNVADQVITLREDLSAPGGSSTIGFLQLGTGAIPRSVQDRLRDDWVSVKDYDAGFGAPAVGDGISDDTLAFQRCLDFCYTQHKTMYIPAGYYAVRESSPGSGYAMLNKGVSIVGEGRFYSQIVPMASMPNTADFIRVQPDSGAYIDFLEFGRFSVQPTYNGATRGKHCISMLFPVATNLSRLHLHDLYLLPGNDYSLHVDNNNVVNAQGVPANSVFERCMFWEGVRLLKIGDSNTLRNNVFRSAVSSGRPAIHVYISDTDGVASHLIVAENNSDCDGGFIYVLRGRNVKILHNNVEHTHGTGTPSGAVIDIDGASGVIPFVDIIGNHIGIFRDATPSSAIRINGASGARVDRNTILTAFNTLAGIFVTDSAGDTDIGMNEIAPDFVEAIKNEGLRTRGASLALGMLNSFTNAGGSYQPLVAFKASNGQVTVAGVVNCPATPNGQTMATLPIGYRPILVQRDACGAVVSGNVAPQAVEVDAAGNIVFQGSNSTTRVEINLTFPTLGYISGSL